MHRLNLPLTAKDIASLKVGDEVSLTGVIYTARDRAHQYLLEEDFDRIKGGVIYHCGPIVKNGKIVAAGPTTSARMNGFTPAVINKYGVKAIIGRGGMNNDVIDALKGNAVYLTAIGGAAVLYADTMKLLNTFKEELGMPEAIYEIEVKDFPAIVAIDSFGSSLYQDVNGSSKLKLESLLQG